MEDLPSDCFEFQKVSYQELSGLNPITKSYLFSSNADDFASFKPNWKGIEDAINKRANFKVYRKTLVEVLEEQYKSVEISELTFQHIQKLKEENCYTFTTGHQLSLFTGPSYFFYKILSVVSLSKAAQKKFSGKHFVPVFWMASEDHDFEEIATTWVDGQKVTWKKNASGAVGRLNLEGLSEAFDSFVKALGKNPQSEPFIENVAKFIADSTTYAQFTFKMVNFLFAEYGVVAIDADHPKLKAKLKEVIKEDLFHQLTFKQAKATADKILTQGFEEQIHIREINFFYLKDGVRERIEKRGDLFRVLNSNISFDAAEMHQEIKKHPERFSPNVALRPVYQETILPNIAYVGGGAEVAYWLQLKSIFEKNKVFYPVVLLRDSALMLPKKAKGWLNDLGLSIEKLFQNQELIFQELVKQKSTANLSLADKKNAVIQVFDDLKPAAQKVQPTLQRTIEGEKQKILNRLNAVEKKLLREEKKNNKVLENRLQKLFDMAYPNGTLQERKANFLPFWVAYKKQILDSFVNQFEPTQAEFKVVFYS